MIKLAVFDWNGTILADVAATVEGFNQQLKVVGRAPVSRKVFLNSFDNPTHHTFANVGVDLTALDEVQQLAVAQAFHSYYESRVKRVRTRHGVRSALQTLTNRGITCIILSNLTIEEIKAQVERLKLSPFFSAILAHDAIGRSHYHDKQQYLENFLSDNNFRIDQSVIIGDGISDIRIGQQLGITTIAITGGFTSTTRLRQAKPDILVSKMADVVKAVEEM